MNQVLDKIAKALNLGTNNSNENEAQSAILAAQRLMAKYHISQEEVNDFINDNDSQDTEVIEERGENELNNDKWKRLLMVTIAKNFRCDVFYRGGKIILVGEKDDIQISKRVYLYAKQAILNNFKKFFKENYQTAIIYNSTRNKYKRDYELGFIKGLSEKFEIQKANSEMSLVVVNQNVKEYLKKINFSGVRHNRPTSLSDTYCYREGKREGRNLADIDTRMEGVI